MGILRDECDDCNAKSSVYEDALTKAVGPSLTLGGTKGKRGVRQTDRSHSNTFGVTIATVQNATLRSAGPEAIRQCPGHCHVKCSNLDLVISV